MNKIDENQRELITDFIRWSHTWMNQRKKPKITEIQLDTWGFEGRNGIQNFRRILGNMREEGEYDDNEQRQFLLEARKWFLKEFKNQWGDSYTNVFPKRYE